MNSGVPSRRAGAAGPPLGGLGVLDRQPSGDMTDTKNIPCPFFFRYNGKKGPCHFGGRCAFSHKPRVCDAYMKKHPEMKKTMEPKSTRSERSERSPGRKPSRSPSRGRTESRRSPSRGRLRTRSSERRRRAAAGQGSRGDSQQRIPSIPPSRYCRYEILHLINGARPCKKGKECTWTHPTSASDVSAEDKAWAKERKSTAPRRNSPGRPGAAGARSNSNSSKSSKSSRTSQSSRSSRSSRKAKKTKKEKKNNKIKRKIGHRARGVQSC